MVAARINVRATDLNAGTYEEKELKGDDWNLVCSGRYYADSVITHANGTVQLTLKLDKEDA